MKSFKTYHQSMEIAESIMEVLTIQQDNMLTEEDMTSFESKKAHLAKTFHATMKKMGVEVRKEKGLLDYLNSATVGVINILFAALRGNKEKVKAIVNSVRKEDLMDFLLKLDVITLHLVSAPIHIIDAVTGWDLWANVRNKAMAGQKAVVQSFRDAIDFLRTKIVDTFDGEEEANMLKKLDALEKEIYPALM